MEKITKRKLFISLGVLVVLGLIVGGYFYWLSSAPARKAAEQKLQNQISAQVFQIAQSGDSSQCNQINYISPDGTDYRQVCMNNAILEKVKETGDISLCASLVGGIKGTCQQYATNFLVQNGKDSSACDGLLDSVNISNCKDLFALKNAITTKDNKGCSVLSDASLSGYCKDQVLIAEIGASEKVLCSNFSDQSLEADCSLFQKSVSGNENSCGPIINQEIKSYCMGKK